MRSYNNSTMYAQYSQIMARERKVNNNKMTDSSRRAIPCNKNVCAVQWTK